METKPRHRFCTQRVAFAIELSELFCEKVELRETIHKAEEEQQPHDVRHSCIVIYNEEDKENLLTEEMKRANAALIAFGDLGQVAIDENNFPLLAKVNDNKHDNSIHCHYLDGLLTELVSLLGPAHRSVDSTKNGIASAIVW
jgi:hypothetical protein